MEFPAHAGNSILASSYTQISNGRYCQQVSRDDLKAAGFTCGFGKSTEQLTDTSWSIFEWNIFQLSAQSQVEKNNCLTEQLSALQNDKTKLRTWYSQLGAAWMGMKKSDLILKKCTAFDIKERIRNLNGLQSEIAKKSPTLKKLPKQEVYTDEWQNLCNSPNKMSALRASNKLFQHALPVISSPKFFEIMESHRGMLVDKKTGSPLSDEDLLKADLQELSFMKLQFTDEFETEIGKSLNELAAERKGITKKLEESKTPDGDYSLNSELKDYIYEDDTLNQTLASKGLLAKYDEDGKMISDVSNGAFCLLSKYQRTPSGEIFAFGVESALAGGILFKALKGTKYLAGLTELQQAKKSAGLGLAVTGYPMIAREIARECPVGLGNEAHRTNKFVSSRLTETDTAIEAASLPKTVSYAPWYLDADPKEIPSCKKLEDKSLKLNAANNSNCALSLILSVAPLKVALPIIFSTGE